jgi:hypothetical protein
VDTHSNSTPTDSIMGVTQDGGGHTQWVAEDSTTGELYMVHKFMHAGAPRASTTEEVFTAYTVSFPEITTVDILVVGGGGAGGGAGFSAGGGGGSGGQYELLQGLPASDTITISVGAGGLGSDQLVDGIEGSASVFDGTGTVYTSMGGGGGGMSWRDSNTPRYSSGTSGAYGGGAGGCSGSTGNTVYPTSGSTGLAD